MGKRLRKTGPPGDEPIALSMGDVEAILRRASEGPLSETDVNTLRAALDTLVFLTQELEKKSVSIQRLKQMLFGASTETTAKVVEKVLEGIREARASSGENGCAEGAGQAASVEKKAGHGRNGAEAYTGANKVVVPLPSLQVGHRCPNCKKGKVYASVAGRHLVRLTGQAPIGGAVYELQQLRCNLCGEIFTAPLPEGIGEEKYNPESASIIGVMKYGTGVPFNRLEKLQAGLGIPLPAATQWEIVEEAAKVIEPAFEQMVKEAAQGKVVHVDDTKMKVLALGAAADTSDAIPSPASQAAAVAVADAARVEEAEKDPAEKKAGAAVFTTGIVSVLEDHEIALFFTGREHAGDNLLDLLKWRSAELGRPIQMCDALSRNMPKELETILSNCLTHGRRKFYDVAASFPDECLYVLLIFKDVYRTDAIAKSSGMSDEERLRLHQAESGPRMAELQAWMAAQFEERKVEPNSSLGEAIAYMQAHWNELTLFLRVAGAPLDNNICERALKKAILHRKNAYFYKTLKGAHVGDLFMSIIHTCELNGANPFNYLTELQKHAEEVRANPDDWMPWNYLRALALSRSPHTLDASRQGPAP